MFDRYLPVFAVVGLAVFVTLYFTIGVPREAARKDTLTFSNTAAWDPEHLAVSLETTRYPATLFEYISLPPPRRNSSSEVARELATLHTYQTMRSAKDVQNIVTEVITRNIPFGGPTIHDYLDQKKFPATAALLTDSIHDLQVIEMQQKKKFDRVRPSLLDRSLEPVIVVPTFPAYPSYHSAEMHFYALILSELAPARTEEFLARADQIAKNREIAGVHYPSDSQVGVLLAQQFFNALLQDAKFQTLLASAKKEWATRPQLLQASTSP
jgi:hypothetical protein